MEYFSCRGPGGMGPVRGGGFGGGRGFGGNRGKKDTCLGSILDIPLQIGLWKRSFVDDGKDENTYVACLHVTNLEVKLMCPLGRCCDEINPSGD